MLPRAALRAIRPSSFHTLHIGHASPTIAARSICVRTYASSSKKSGRPPPPPSASAKTARPPTPLPYRGATGSARQTSPGTSFPKDETWKPQDGIKFDGPVATTVSGAGKAASKPLTANKSAETMVDGSRPVDPSVVKRESILEQDNMPHEPLAQRADADEPPPSTLRSQARSKQAVAENQALPPDAPVQPDDPLQTQKPLPDLRFGIPSTLDFELNQKRGERATAQSAETQDQGGMLDLTSAPPETQERREKEDREYDRSAYETSLDRRRAQFANYMYASILFLALTGGFYLARPFSVSEEVPAGLDTGDADGWSPGSMYARMRARLGNQVGYYTEPSFPSLLPEVPASQRPPFTLVLSLEDLMIHSAWDRKHGYRTAKRPGIDYFIRYLSQYYELVLFTSVPLAMADPIIKKLDPYHFIMWPLGREATKYDGGEYVKDLAYLNRPLDKTLIIDTHAPHVKNQPENAIILPKWSGDPKDPHTKDLVALIPFLEYVATMGIDDVRTVLKSFDGQSIPEEFARREAEARAKFNAQLQQERRHRPSFSVGSLAGGLGIKSSPGTSGGMVLADGQSVAEGLAQGKMLSDQIREQGQKQYEFLEQQIREHGAQWLKEEEEEQKKMAEAQVRDMKKGAFSWFGGGGGDKAA